jgi:hypothetical protein
MPWVLFAVHVHGWLFGWLYVLLFYGWATSFRLSVKTLDGEPLILTNTWRDWVVKERGKSGWSFWKWTTTIGRGMIGQPGAFENEYLVRHEVVHIRQSADQSMRGLILGAIVAQQADNPVLGWALWASAWTWPLTNFVSSLLRNWCPRPAGVAWAAHWLVDLIYRRSEHENSARAQTTPRLGGSWIEVERGEHK